MSSSVVRSHCGHAACPGIREGVVRCRKHRITWLFGAAIVAVVAGFVTAIAAVVAALAGGAFVLGGPQVVRVNVEALGGTVVALVIASLLVAAGAVAAIASWIAALLNTARLDDKGRGSRPGSCARTLETGWRV